eukprot:scaffold14227_cov37-Phaeocystis_antarctica.AAC.1
MPRRLPHRCDMAFAHCHICLRALQLLSQSALTVRVAGYLPISYGLLYSEVPATPRVISYRKSDVPRW